MLSTLAADNMAIIAYNNLVGGQDELVFDGNSMILDEKGELTARGKQFEEDLIMADLNVEAVSRARQRDARWHKASPALEEERCRIRKIAVSEEALNFNKPQLHKRQVKQQGLPEEIYQALVLGTRDYVLKNGFRKVIIGLSGGIDSSLVATIAVDALGPSNMIGVAMPSPYSSPGSIVDAKALAKNLGIKLLALPIDEIFQSYTETLKNVFQDTKPDIAEENIQARIRGNILMALSNKFGWLVLTTSNKSETATGYTTLYGDMAGGFAVIKDVPKTTVYELARHRNSLSESPPIPASVIEKAPSAELRPNQKDADSLPPYEQLDPILTAYVEEDKSIEQIVGTGFDAETVKKVARLVDISEYKRRQAAPGIKITPRAFGRDRRLPITNRFKS
jgi:NAD+ synthase (glutamine-hydrolysing)